MKLSTTTRTPLGPKMGIGCSLRKATFEQKHKLLAQIKSVVNSRPIFARSDIEVSYTSVPESDLGHVAVNRLDY